MQLDCENHQITHEENAMRDAVIVSTARTPIGKAFRGAFNATQPQELAAHAISHAISRALVEPRDIDDVVLGCAMQQGPTGYSRFELFTADCEVGTRVIPGTLNFPRSSPYACATISSALSMGMLKLE
jgi:acetyl-CoA acetyltransferase